MKMRYRVATLTVVSALAACGGGGSSGPGPTPATTAPTTTPTTAPPTTPTTKPTATPTAKPTATPTPKPTTTPTPTPAPTPLPTTGSYLPFAPGMAFAFQDGSTIVDDGPTALPASPTMVAEGYDFYGDAGNTPPNGFLGTLYFVKGTPPWGPVTDGSANPQGTDVLTSLVAVANATGELNILTVGPGTVATAPYPGIPLTDDTPFTGAAGTNGESFLLSYDASTPPIVDASTCDCAATFGAVAGAVESSLSQMTFPSAPQVYPYYPAAGRLTQTLGNILLTNLENGTTTTATNSNFYFAPGIGFARIDNLNPGANQQFGTPGAQYYLDIYYNTANPPTAKLRRTFAKPTGRVLHLTSRKIRIGDILKGM